jgi:tRNA(fMet)-specific endonuclease VapC
MVSATVLGELLAGFAAGSRQTQNRGELTRFLDSPRVKVAPCGVATADFYALVYAALRRQGHPIPTNDLWIAASSLEHGAALLTLDAHFHHVGGLRVGAQLEDFLP